MKNSTSTSPRVSMALPVYNGENYLKEAIESHLAQTFEDFELLLSDNASTDGTRDICEHYAKLDKRVKYIRNETNVGGFNNFTNIVDKAVGEYFKWSAHDDVCSENFLKSCVEKLDSDPSIILCTAREIAIDQNGDILEGYMDKYPKLENIDSTSLYRRFRDSACLNHGCFKVFGVLRTEVLRNTPKLANFIGSDRLLLAELALKGPFWESPEPIYFRRHPEQYCAMNKDSERINWFDPKNRSNFLCTESRKFVEYVKTINRVSLSWYSRMLCYFVMLEWLIRWRKRLTKEALITIMSRVGPRQAESA